MIGSFGAKFDRCLTDESGNVILTLTAEGADAYAAKKFAAQALTARQNGKERLKIEIDLYRNKRSLSANAYMWVLCDEIAKKLRTTKDEIYRKYIREVGIFRPQTLDRDITGTLTTAWEMLGTGYIVETVGLSREDGKVELRFYYGSSVYSVKQMTRLIDSIVEDCAELGIETKNKAELESLLSAWGKECEVKTNKGAGDRAEDKGDHLRTR